MNRADAIARELHQFCHNRAPHAWATHLPEAHAIDALTKQWITSAVQVIRSNIATEAQALEHRTARAEAAVLVEQKERDELQAQLESAAISRCYLAQAITPDLLEQAGGNN
jgi:hypothetical protein